MYKRNLKKQNQKKKRLKLNKKKVLILKHKKLINLYKKNLIFLLKICKKNKIDLSNNLNLLNKMFKFLLNNKHKYNSHQYLIIHWKKHKNKFYKNKNKKKNKVCLGIKKYIYG